ncbi:TMEM165/GDT1 family protein [Aeromicrobium ginsengisoli]|uniref:GDT1 family protein n=1 Tax=Aeromicrobium ginsengisoli TaxID=363867 RepID=A0A5M4FJ88_9ACTN|nr:TMEM165/GDT1 family protein [Aeromicrobium ginsengisoli]KAA1399823.1 TMEM165/GDT1 family protein [Aeromicrobium ginsengisoli]
MYAVLLSAALVFVAELGDKSQLMSMTFATRYRARTVILGAGLACTLTNLVSALVGNAIGDALPEHAVRLAGGVLFLVFAALTLRHLAAGEEPKPPATGGAAVFVVGAAFVLSELGDKTMLATMTLSTQYHWILIWIGSTIGMLVSIVLAVFVGRALLQVLPIKAVHLVSALLFAGVGVWMLVG